MRIIDNLIELEITIKKIYTKLVECEINDNQSEYESFKSIAKRLITSEHKIFRQIINDNNLLIELNNFLFENLYQDYDVYDEMFLKNLNGKYEALVLLRIYNRFNNYLIHLNKEQVLELADDEILKKLNIPLSKLEEVSVFNWNIINLINGTSSKFEFLFLNEKINSNSYSKEDYTSLVYYKNLLVYSNPILEHYFLGEEELSLTPPDILKQIDNYSYDYQKVYQDNIQQSVLKNINYIVNIMLLKDIDYSQYTCNKETLNTIYLIGIKASLCLLDEDKLKKVIDNINTALDNNFIMLAKNGKIKEYLKIKDLLETCSSYQKTLK